MALPMAHASPIPFLLPPTCLYYIYDIYIYIYTYTCIYICFWLVSFPSDCTDESDQHSDTSVKVHEVFETIS